jgi:hypothetical protein
MNGIESAVPSGQEDPVGESHPASKRRDIFTMSLRDGRIEQLRSAFHIILIGLQFTAKNQPKSKTHFSLVHPASLVLWWKT